MKNYVAGIVLFIAIFALTWSQAQSITLKAGVYSVQGSDYTAEEEAYQGTCTVKCVATADHSLYKLSWKLGQSDTEIGVGFLDGAVLRVVYATGKRETGIASYRLEQDGVLEGQWISLNQKSYGTETLTFVSDLPIMLKPGMYSVQGIDLASKESYLGTCEVRCVGEEKCRYTLSWKLGQNETEVGVGILDGSILSVCYQTDKGEVGVGSYRLTPNNVLEGQWSSSSVKNYGTETLTRVSDLPK